MSVFDDFLSKYAPAFNSGGSQSNIAPSFIAAQAGLESNWGQSGLATTANNLFGIKGSGDAGSISMMTNEFIGGRMVKVPQNFAMYSSPEASVSAYTRLLSGGKRYAGIVGADAMTAAGIIGKSGYATDPNYGSKIANAISKIDKSGALAGGVNTLLSSAKNAGIDAALGAADMVTFGLASQVGGMFGLGGGESWVQQFIDGLKSLVSDTVVGATKTVFIKSGFIQRTGLFIVGAILLLMAFYLLGRNSPAATIAKAIA